VNLIGCLHSHVRKQATRASQEETDTSKAKTGKSLPSPSSSSSLRIIDSSRLLFFSWELEHRSRRRPRQCPRLVQAKNPPTCQCVIWRMKSSTSPPPHQDLSHHPQKLNSYSLNQRVLHRSIPLTLVYVHPTPRAKDNIPGWFALVERQGGPSSSSIVTRKSISPLLISLQ
jgi:hypothetical protein